VRCQGLCVWGGGVSCGVGPCQGHKTWLLDTMESLTGGGTVQQPLRAAIGQLVLQLGSKCLHSKHIWHSREHTMGDTYGAAHGGRACVRHHMQDDCVWLP